MVVSVPWASSPRKRTKIPRGCGAQAPSPAFGRGFFTVVSQESFAAAEGTPPQPGEAPGVGPGGSAPWGSSRLAGIFDRGEVVSLAQLKVLVQSGPRHAYLRANGG